MQLCGNDEMAEQPAAEERPAIPGPGAEPAARRWVELGDRRRELEAALAGEQAGRGRWTLSGRRADREAEELQGMPARTRECAALLASTAAGSTRDWGALSVIPCGPYNPVFSLEQTLFSHRRALPPAWLEAIDVELPQIRAATQLGRGGRDLHQLHQSLLEQAANAPRKVAVTLLEHLPGPLRPLPARVAELERRTSHVTLFVSETQRHDEDWRVETEPGRVITLHDIVVHGEGRGLGTAVLTQLCRYADDTGSTIVGELEPGPQAPDQRVPVLARWYAHHGFTSGNRPPGEWSRGATITRPSGTSASR